MIDSPPCYAPPAYVRAGQTVVLPALRCDSFPPTPRLVVRQGQYGNAEATHGQVVYTANASAKPSYYVLDSVAFDTYEAADEYQQSIQVVPASSNYAPRCTLADPDHPGPMTIEIEADETVPLAARCEDGESDPFTSGFDAVTFGAVDGIGGAAYAYTPPAEDPGPDGTTVKLAFRATDQPPAPAKAASSNPAALSIHVVRADHNPVCVDQTVVVVESSTTTVPVTCTDADPGDTLSLGIPGQPADMRVDPAGDTPALYVTPQRGFTGTETVAFDASDGDDTSPPATLTVIVVPRDHTAALRRKVKTYLRDAIAPGVLRAVQHRQRIGPFPQAVTIEARVAGASTTLASGSLNLAPGRARTVRLRLSRSGRILRHRGRLHGRLTVTVGTDGVAGRATGTYR